MLYQDGHSLFEHVLSSSMEVLMSFCNVFMAGNFFTQGSKWQMVFKSELIIHEEVLVEAGQYGHQGNMP